MTPPNCPMGSKQSILEEAVQSPSVAMMRLSIEVDRQLRLILAATGPAEGLHGPVAHRSARPHSQKLWMSPQSFLKSLRGTIESFWSLRNDVVHGHVGQHLTIRAVDYGLRILKMLHAIPRRSYIVRLQRDAALLRPGGQALCARMFKA